jgi:hypothetical protein
LGSFPQYIRPPPGETGSIVTSSVPNSADGRHGRDRSREASRGRRGQSLEDDEQSFVSSPPSKLRGIINRLKKDNPSSSLFMTESRSFRSMDIYDENDMNDDL